MLITIQATEHAVVILFRVMELAALMEILGHCVLWCFYFIEDEKALK